MPIIADVQSLWGALGRFAVVLSDGRVLCSSGKTCEWIPIEIL